MERAMHSPLLENGLASAPIGTKQRRPLNVIIWALTGSIVLLALVALVGNPTKLSPEPFLKQLSKRMKPSEFLRDVTGGLSAKSNPPDMFQQLSYDWTDTLFASQRTAFHFQPPSNWMSGPDGPLFHMGYYHLFYEYNPDNATSGCPSWGHAVSSDLIHWYVLPLALVPDRSFDSDGVWTGSATVFTTGDIMMLYTGGTGTKQVQNLAYPSNLTDPLLREWEKFGGNPVISPPSGIETNEFRGPSTAWNYEGKWYITIGSRKEVNGEEAGVALLYRTDDFKSFTQLTGVLHEVKGTGMWDRVDFYPISKNGLQGVDTSAYGPGLKFVLKASLNKSRADYYAIGAYNAQTKRWTPDNSAEDVGLGLKYDYGNFYASKTFFDIEKQRRILWGLINETDSEADDVEKGWASIQAIPRSILFDNETGSNLIIWPVAEIEDLRRNSTVFEEVVLEPGSIVPLDVGSATQLDIIAEFEINYTSSAVENYNCSGGAAEQSLLGPFGLLVLADESLSELTPIYFRPVSPSGSGITYFCTDGTRSSEADDVLKVVYGTTVPVLEDELFTMRVLVDHSVVESFAQEGRRVISTRVYPTKAIYDNARVFLFNNATGVNVTAMVTVWQLDSATISSHPLGMGATHQKL